MEAIPIPTVTLSPLIVSKRGVKMIAESWGGVARWPKVHPPSEVSRNEKLCMVSDSFLFQSVPPGHLGIYKL